MFDRKALVDSFADMIGEIDRVNSKFIAERREKELIIKRTDAALARCKDMIETLANALANARIASELVKDARIYLSILEGYVEPYTPSKTYPNMNDLSKMDAQKKFYDLLKKDRERRSAGERYAEEKAKRPRGRPRKK